MFDYIHPLPAPNSSQMPLLPTPLPLSADCLTATDVLFFWLLKSSLPLFLHVSWASRGRVVFSMY